jgi:hypothetical protein
MRIALSDTLGPMIRATRFALALAAASLLGTVAVSRPALADPPSAKALPVYVLSISTDDADDQADALTQALRARVRSGQGWSLLETPQSFETLSIALKCPPKPDSACLGRIADQIHADHFVWGTMKKKGHQVVTVVHMWSRGSGDENTSETYSDNLKDAGDESLRKIAGRIFAALAGSVAPPTGTVIVHAGHAGGDVLVDGEKQGTLQGGAATVEVPPGPHTITVRVPGFESGPQSATVAASGQAELTFRLSAPGGGDESHSSFPVRKVAMYTTLIVGGALLAVGAVGTGIWISDSIQDSNDVKKFNVPNACTTQQNSAAADSCRLNSDAKTASTVAWVTGGIGAAVFGTGLYLLLTDHKDSDSSPDAGSPPSARRKIDVVPTIGMRGGALDVVVTF